MPVSRRDFLGAAALSAVAPTLISATGMPMRTLGKTGAQVSILAFGGGSRFVSYGEEKGLDALNHALDLGITYIDSGVPQPEVTHNDAIRALDALVQLIVQDRDLASPPGSQSDGQRWIVAASPTGARRRAASGSQPSG